MGVCEINFYPAEPGKGGMMLKSETNSKSTEGKILTAARKHFKQRKGVQADFEHGQWWISLADGSQYSVNDDNSDLGFCFEQVTPPSDI